MKKNTLKKLRLIAINLATTDNNLQTIETIRYLVDKNNNKLIDKQTNKQKQISKKTFKYKTKSQTSIYNSLKHIYKKTPHNFKNNLLILLEKKAKINTIKKINNSITENQK